MPQRTIRVAKFLHGTIETEIVFIFNWSLELPHSLSGNCQFSLQDIDFDLTAAVTPVRTDSRYLPFPGRIDGGKNLPAVLNRSRRFFPALIIPLKRSHLLGVARGKIEIIYAEEKKENEAIGNCNPEACEPAVLPENSLAASAATVGVGLLSNGLSALGADHDRLNF